MGSCAAPSAKGDDKFITTDYLQQCPVATVPPSLSNQPAQPTLRNLIAELRERYGVESEEGPALRDLVGTLSNPQCRP